MQIFFFFFFFFFLQKVSNDTCISNIEHFVSIQSQDILSKNLIDRHPYRTHCGNRADRYRSNSGITGQTGTGQCCYRTRQIQQCAGIFLTRLGTGPVPVPLGKIATYCSKFGIFTVW